MDWQMCDRVCAAKIMGWREKNGFYVGDDQIQHIGLWEPHDSIYQATLCAEQLTEYDIRLTRSNGVWFANLTTDPRSLEHHSGAYPTPAKALTAACAKTVIGTEEPQP